MAKEIFRLSYLKGRIFILAKCLFICNTGNCQISDSTASKLFYLKDQVCLVANPFYMKGQVTSDPALPGYFTKPSPGFKAGVLYDFNFNSKWGIETGIMGGFHTIGVGYRIPQNHSYNSWDGLYDLETWALMEIPLRLSFQKNFTRKLKFRAAAGISLFRFSGSGLHMTAVDTTGVLSAIDYNISPGQGLFGFYNLSTGILLRLANQDFLRFSINYTSQADETKIAFGNWFWQSGGNVISQGTYSLSGNSLGLEIGYVFSRVKELQRQLMKEGIH